MITKDLGLVTAYAYAVAGGYTGTEAEFTELLGNIATDLEEIENLTVTVDTLPPGSEATASYSDGVLHLGIPRGDKGDKGDTGETGPQGPKGDPGDVSTEQLDEAISGVRAEMEENYARNDGYYEEMTVGDAEQLISTQFVEDSDPYLFRPTGGSADVGNREYVDKIVGGTVAWNQLVSESATSVTVQSGHKYIAKIGGAWSVAASSGSAISVTGGTDMLIDLTALFNPTIADYIYSLEQSQAGAGVAWFRRYFSKSYYPYDPGTLRSVEGVSAHETVGFNQWDEEWRNGYYNAPTGEFVSYADQVANANPIKVLPNTTYHITPVRDMGGARIVYRDSDGNLISIEMLSSSGAGNFTTPSNCAYIDYCTMMAYGTTYNHDICINLSWSGTRNGEYEPYRKHTYPLDSSLTLRGVPKLVDGKLAFDGDVYPPSGEVQRRYGVKLLDGTDGWFSEVSLQTTGAGEKYVGYINKANKNIPTNDFDSIATRFVYKGPTTGLGVCGQMDYNGGGSYLRFVLPDGITTLAELNAWLASNPVTLVYELATPTTETAEGYEQYQICDQSGTEEFVTTGIVPVGHETRYPANLRDKLQHLPDLPSPLLDGTYMVMVNGSQMYLEKLLIPEAPTTDGTYALKATVSGGTPVYTWEVEA